MGMKTTVGKLTCGQYAILDNGMSVLCMSDRSFTPKYEGYCNVVNLQNGIGSFLPNYECTVVSMKQAFENLIK